MARKAPSRLEMRKQVEAAEAAGASGEKASEAKEKKTRKTAAKTPTTRAKRTKEKVQARKRLVWVVYSGSLKDEGRFPYDQKDAAYERIEQLKLKSKKMYFIMPVKEILGEGGVVIQKPAAVDLDDEPVKPKKRPARSDDDEEDGDDDSDDDDDDE